MNINKKISLILLYIILFTFWANDAWSKTLDAGNGYTIAIKSDGTLWSWGSNVSGRLGDGTNEDKNIPVQIGTDLNWQTIATGNAHTIVIKSNGTLWAWGVNNSGQLGDGTTESKNTPTQIGTDLNWQTITAGFNHTLAIKSDGTLWAWGDNSYGCLGDGTGFYTNPFLVNLSPTIFNTSGILSLMLPAILSSSKQRQ